MRKRVCVRDSLCEIVCVRENECEKENVRVCV